MRMTLLHHPSPGETLTGVVYPGHAPASSRSRIEYGLTALVTTEDGGFSHYQYSWLVQRCRRRRPRLRQVLTYPIIGCWALGSRLRSNDQMIVLGLLPAVEQW